MYSTKSELTKKVCKEFEIDFNAKFVKTMQRKGKIYVSGTLGKPDEWWLLKRKCIEFGYIYKGR